LSGTGLEALRVELAREQADHKATFDFFTEEVYRRMGSHGASLEQLVEARNQVLDLREALQRIHSEADVPEVNEVALRVRTIAQAALEGGGT
jgi:hypothetical protein